MVSKEVIEKMELFDGIHVTRITGTLNSQGNTDGLIEAIVFNGCNIPKALLECVTTMSQSAQVTPVSIHGNYAVQELVHGPTTYEVTFKYDRKFLYLLDKAHEAELYKKHNVEADAFIEEWLGNG